MPIICRFFDRAGLVNRLSSRSLLLSVVGIPPQNADYGEAGGSELYLVLFCDMGRYELVPSSVPARDAPTLRRISLRAGARVREVRVLLSCYVGFSCRGEILRRGWFTPCRPEGGSGFPHREQHRRQLACHGDDRLLHARPLGDAQSPGLQWRHEADTPQERCGRLEQHGSHARITTLGDPADDVGLSRLPSAPGSRWMARAGASTTSSSNASGGL